MEVYRYMLPGPVRERQWLQESWNLVAGNSRPTTVVAVLYKLADILDYAGPVVVYTYYLLGLVISQVGSRQLAVGFLDQSCL